MLSIPVKRLITAVLVLIILVSALSLIPFESYATDDSIYTSADGMWQYRFRDGSRIGVSLTSGKKYECAYLGEETQIEIPSVIDGYRVSEIGEYAFYGMDRLTSITIPYTVNSIGNCAFALCTSVSGVAIPTGTYEIGSYCFLGCSSLEAVSISQGLERIGYRAFYGCPKLVSIELPRGIKNISRQAFEGTPIVNNAQGEVFINGCLLVADSKVSGEYTVDGSAEIIAGGAFENCVNVSSVKLPDGLMYISDGAFEGCAALKEISIPDSVIEVGEFAFSHCPKLQSVTIGSSVSVFGDEAAYDCGSLERFEISSQNISYACLDGVLYNKEMTELIRYPSAKKDKEFSLPSSVRGISASAFKDARFLECVKINKGIFGITPNCFENCISLKAVSLPDSLRVIESEAFYKCVSLTDISFPTRLRTIERRAFSLCTSLEVISLPDRLETVERGAFEGCVSLKELDIRKCRASFSDSVFRHCTSLESVVLPDTLISISDYMFADCSSLSGITFSKSNLTIGNGAFGNCISVNKIYIPSNIYTIKSRAFSGCTSLEIIKFSDGIERIGANAFENCISLKYVNLPDSITVIGDGAFTNCSGLRGITLDKSVSAVGRGILEGCLPESISGYNGTYAEILAKMNGIPFDSLGYPFWDDPEVPEEAWFFEAIKYCANKGYIRGTHKGVYKPSEDISREDFLIMLSRVSGVKPSDYADREFGFEDVEEGKYYTYAVNWAYENSIANGISDTEFGIGRTLTREQMVLILYRLYGSPYVADTDELLSGFEDADSLSEESRSAFAWAITNSIISGMTETEIGADGVASRAMAATVIMRIDNQD